MPVIILYKAFKNTITHSSQVCGDAFTLMTTNNSITL